MNKSRMGVYVMLDQFGRKPNNDGLAQLVVLRFAVGQARVRFKDE